MINKLSISKKACHVRKCILSLSAKLLACALLCAVFAVCALFIPQKVTYEYASKAPSEEENTENVVQASETLRLIREKDGKIGVFKTDGSLIRTINVSVSLLTEYDRQLLSEGIVANEGELSELIESLKS